MKLDEAERQMVLLALARLSIERPGWDDAINRLALKVDDERNGRAALYDAFREQQRPAAAQEGRASPDPRQARIPFT
jgi:uncharacterized protein HemY